ncbi:periplasmic nitrate reductase, NapE protein [Rhizobium sp. 'Codium 1']|uniref:periplasmic nitrate reductase, NapE protein n=1 Tax=Rhizobium sp. 'Codium 1' TaxID=2940484 RepID=UPI003B6415B1
MQHSTETTIPLSASDRRVRRRSEIVTFFILAFGIWPILAVAAVGGFGFMVWMYQIIVGPPGPPA